MEWSQNHFSLIVIGNDDLPIFHRPSGEASFPADRLFEYTEDDLKDRYQNDIASLVEMAALVVPEISAPNETQPAFLTRIGQIERRGRDVHFLYEHLFKWYPAKAVFNCGYFNVDVRNRGIDERSRTHWAVKKGNLVQGLKRLFGDQSVEGSSPVLTAEQWTPLPPGPVCVLMPFSEGSNVIYDTIQAVCRSQEMETLRFDNEAAVETYSGQVLAAIKQSKLVISDLTGSNPNVLYETGLAIGLGQDVIIIAQDQNDIPLHLTDRNAIQYLPSATGLQQLMDNLEAAIRGRAGKWQSVSSLEQG